MLDVHGVWEPALEVRQFTPSTVKHPARIPPAKVDVAPETVRLFVILKSVEVAAVEVESPIVRNWKVDDAEKIPDVAVREPTFCSEKELAKMFEVHGV